MTRTLSAGIRNKIAILITVLGAAMAVGAPAPASGQVSMPTAAGIETWPGATASDVGAQGCQNVAATLHYYYYKNGVVTDWPKNCSGYYTLNSAGYRLDSGGWSGYVSHADGSRTYFCDWELHWLHNKPRVTGIYMAETRAPWC